MDPKKPTQEPVEKQYTAEEIKKMRDNMRTFYKEENSFLKLQAENARLKAEIKTSNVIELKATHEEAQIFAAIEQYALEAKLAQQRHESKTPPAPSVPPTAEKPKMEKPVKPVPVEPVPKKRKLKNQ